MKDIYEAAKDLRIHLGRPSWISSIGIGDHDERPTIIVFLVQTPIHADPIPDTWEGYPVITREFGPFVPLGSW